VRDGVFGDVPLCKLGKRGRSLRGPTYLRRITTGADLDEQTLSLFPGQINRLRGAEAANCQKCLLPPRTRLEDKRDLALPPACAEPAHLRVPHCIPRCEAFDSSLCKLTDGQNSAPTFGNEQPLGYQRATIKENTGKD
jgi:hypothetical protein